MTRTMLIAGPTALFTLASLLFAQDKPSDRDTTPHSARFVAVDDNIKLEVLDWGGSGRPIILLLGGNRTAHDFDQFAPKLTDSYHAFGITRRGSGVSSAPPPTDANYSADRLGDDVLAVINDLGLDRPVLVGHSLGGQELSSVGSRHPEKVASLIYLEAAYAFAYYDRSRGFLDIEVNEVRRKTNSWSSASDRQIPGACSMSYCRRIFPSWRGPCGRFKNASGTHHPQCATAPRPPIPPVDAAINRGSQRYTEVRAPVLAIYAFEAVPNGSPARAAVEASNQMKRDQAAAFEAVLPSARVVRLENARHDVFRSNESEVLQEIRDFIARLPKPGDNPIR